MATFWMCSQWEPSGYAAGSWYPKWLTPSRQSRGSEKHNHARVDGGLVAEDRNPLAGCNPEGPNRITRSHDPTGPRDPSTSADATAATAPTPSAKVTTRSCTDARATLAVSPQGSTIRGFIDRLPLLLQVEIRRVPSARRGSHHRVDNELDELQSVLACCG